jgi:proteic killer suppression protein
VEYWRYTLPLHNENNLKTMEIHFDKEYLQQLYEEGKTKDKKYRFQPQMVKRYQLRIKTLEYVQNIEELYAIRSFHYEVLKGDKAGISSIRVNDQYRIEFTVKQSTSETVVTICNILELSNHYK